jgi:hypothetical protein
MEGSNQLVKEGSGWLRSEGSINSAGTQVIGIRRMLNAQLEATPGICYQQENPRIRRHSFHLEIEMNSFYDSRTYSSFLHEQRDDQKL